MLAAERLNPRGPERLDLAAASIAQVVANVNRREGTPAYKIADFLPEFFQEPSEPLTGDQLAAKMRAINAALGGVENGNDRKSGGQAGG